MIQNQVGRNIQPESTVVRYMQTRLQKAKMAGASQVNEQVNDVVTAGEAVNRETAV